MKFKGREITYLAVMVALAAIANVFAIPLDGANRQISFAYIPAFIAGAYMGIIAGAIVGGLGDIIGCLIASQGVWLPLLTLASILLGVLPGVIFMLFEKPLSKKLNPIIARLILTWAGIVAILIVCTAGLNTLNIWFVFSSSSKTFWAYLVFRFPLQALVAVINGVVLSVFVSIPAVDTMMKKQMGGLFGKKLS